MSPRAYRWIMTLAVLALLGLGLWTLVSRVQRRGHDPAYIRGMELRAHAVSVCRDSVLAFHHIGRWAAIEWGLQITEDPDTGRYLDTQGMVSGADPNWRQREVRCRWDTVTKKITRVSVR